MLQGWPEKKPELAKRGSCSMWTAWVNNWKGNIPFVPKRGYCRDRPLSSGNTSQLHAFQTTWVCVSPQPLIWCAAKARWELPAVREVRGVHHKIRITLLPPNKCTPSLKGGSISAPTKDHLMGIWIPAIVYGTQFQQPQRCHPLIGDREERQLTIPRLIGRSFFLN